MTEDERYGTLIRLRASNARFLPITEDEILHHLNRAQIVDGEVVESWELLVIRRYAAACLLQEEILVRSTVTDGVVSVGELPFVARLQNAVLEALRTLWEAAEDEVAGQVRAEWLLANMYLGYAGVTTPVPWTERPDLEHLV